MMLEPLKDKKPFCAEEFRHQWINVCLSLQKKPNRINKIQISCVDKAYLQKIKETHKET